jgi:hypothetical protein
VWIPERREYERKFSMNRKTRLISSRIVAAALGTTLAFGIAAPAFAQTTTTPIAATAAQTAREAARTAQIADFAKRLGVTVEKLTQATKEQRKADIDKAVAAGKITAAEAVTIKAAIDAGTKPVKGLGFGKGGAGMRDKNGSATGVARVRKTAAERKAAADAAAAEFAGRLGVTPAALVAAGKDQAKARVDADLAAGYLTAAQAAAEKAVIDAADGVGSGRGGFGGFGGGRGHRGGGGRR